MTAEEIRKLYWKEPFEPFQIVLKDGREIPVARREYLSIAMTGNRLAIAPRIEQLEFVDLAEVTGVRPLTPPTAGATSPQTGAA